MLDRQVTQQRQKRAKCEIKGKPVTEQYNQLLQEWITNLSLNGYMLWRNPTSSHLFALVRFLGWGVGHICSNEQGTIGY